MSDAALYDLARAAGLQPDWRDASGEAKTVGPESLRALMSAMDLPCASPAQIAESRARLEVEAQGEGRETFLTVTAGEWVRTPLAEGQVVEVCGAGVDGSTRRLDTRLQGGGVYVRGPDQPGYYAGEGLMLACAPRRAWTLTDAAPGRRLWGVAAQLASLRGSRPEDFGDFGALEELAAALGRRGADALALSPVHALFAADPTRFSPYAPSSRLFLNVMFAEAAQSPDASTLSTDDLIDWPRAGRARLARLRAAFDAFEPSDTERAQLEAFRLKGAEALTRHARFEALSARFLDQTGGPAWTGWPEAFHDPASSAVAEFAHAHPGEVEFHVHLQWRAAQGLARAQAASRASGMAVGLIADLAVGGDAGGSQVWSNREAFLTGVSVGAPPDVFQPAGQDWGLAALSPRAFRSGGLFKAFGASLSAALRHAGGVRIDHAMGLRRLWLTPHGASPAEGAYLSYPFEDMMRLIALESWLAKAIVVGEDLGTVPEGFREATTTAGMMGMRVLWFERGDDDAFLAPDRWPREAMAMTSTHDLPTVAGWWAGRDIDWMERHGRQGRRADPAADRADREEDRSRLWRAFTEAGVAEGPAPPPADGQDVVDAAVAYVAASGCDLAMVPLEDLAGEVEQPNLPGTIDEHPNWRRRMPAASDALLQAPRLAARLARLTLERPDLGRPDRERQLRGPANEAQDGGGR